MKSLDIKLANIHANPSGARDFILADAKDADMAFGIASPGIDPRTGRMRSLADLRDQMREITKQGLVDIMLMSASSSEILTIKENLFASSPVTPAIRANDTTDIHLVTGSNYATEPSRPFRTALLDHVMYGHVDPKPGTRRVGVDLGLYSITLNNQIEFDYETLLAYKDFRIEAEQKGFRHFLEVFDPNACGGACPHNIGRFLNDLIARTLAGVASSGRPIFLKIPFHGREAMEQLVAYDPHLIPGILGGSSGTTYDAFKLLEEARASGARAALFGRKINTADHQLTFVRFLRAIADGQIKAQEAVKAYHAELEKLKIKPTRSLKEDSELTATASAYAGSSAAPSKPGAAPASKLAPSKPKVTIGMGGSGSQRASRTTSATPASTVIAKPAAAVPTTDGVPRKPDGSPDFKQMSPAQKVAYARQRIQSDMVRNNDGNGSTRR